MDFKSRIFSSSVYRLLGNLVRIVITLLITPFLIGTLGNEQYGLWLLIVAAVSWFQVMDFGFSSAVQRNIAIALEKGDNHSINVTYSCAVVLFTLLGVVAAAVFSILSFYPSLLGVTPEYRDIARTVILIFVLKVFWDMMMNIYHGFYAGLIRYDIDANINTLNEVTKAVAVYLLVLNYQIIGAVIATMLADVLSNTIKIAYVKKLYSNFAFNRKLVTFSEIRSLFRYSKHVVALDVATILDVRLYALLVSHVVGLAAVTVFGVAQRLVVLVEQLYLSVLGVFLPVFTRLATRRSDMDAMLGHVVSLNAYLVSVCFVPLIALNRQFVSLWLGPEFQDVEVLVFAVSLAFSCKVISRPIGELLLAQANHKLLAVVRLSSIIVTMTLALALGSEFGLIGIVSATLIGGVGGDVILHLFLYRRYSSGRVGSLALYFLRMLVVVVVLSLLGARWFNSLSQLSWLQLFFSAGLVTMLTAILSWKLTLSPEARSKIQSLIRQKLRAQQTVGD